MRSPDLSEFRRRITDELTRTDESIARATASADTVMLDPASVGRLSRMDALQQQAMAQAMVSRLSLRRRGLLAAMQRVEAGTFGRCCQCEAEIDPERLELDPMVVFCSECMDAREAARGGRGTGSR